ncbi:MULTISPECIES: hypothetical protein [unclassified Paenibacillus]|uniref:Uncharacterized protein n=1 Tax=Paenibacillus provencensis TaxID=441151 RepID=A0ABW3Q2G8_9BACL|nr:MULTISPECIES: hypothetical protein [unclassified Paenibacillus]MCM3130621.1 hypothetical protein [Paenibacillus sp. MER 78]SDX74291.1 hypothetical protein SAMN05518848_11349 [Paenibacillus sp. PDC88]SFS89717.1 hypothetical protein SAMN04488601_106169 [Paenibacillus sp. 453mf]
MKKYSLIRSELDSLQSRSNIKGILSTILTLPSRSTAVFMKIDLPEYEVLRAQVFLEDIADKLEDDAALSIVDLIALLLKDFLHVTTTTKMEDLKTSLLEMKKKYLSKTETIEELVELSPGRSSLQLKEKPRRVKYYTLELTVPRKTALRLEIVLYDLEQMFKSFKIGMDELVAIVFLEFVHHLKIGKQKDMIKRFIQCFG